MTVCEHFLRGYCKFGDRCKFEHVQQRAGGFRNQSWSSGGQTNSGSGPIVVPFTKDGVEKDMKPGSEKPMWPLSSFGAAKSEPTIIANLDESPEELRWRAVQALKSGNVADYQKHEAEKIQEADQTYAKALSEITQVYDFAQKTSISVQKNITNPVGTIYNSPTNTASVAFGKPAPSAFGGSAFGSSTPASTSAFGASTSAFGSAATATPAFGKSVFGQTGQSAFGQSAFGQPSQTTSAFGQPAQSTSAFGGGGIQQQTTSAFGQPAQSTSAFGGGGTQQQTTSAFGQTSQPQTSFIKPATAFGGSTGGGFSAFARTGTSAFGGGAQQTTTPTFGQSAFGGGGSNTGAAPSTSAFGNAAQNTSAPSAFGTPAGASGSQTTSTFGLPAKPVSAFGQPSQTTSAFGQTSTPVSAFGQTTQTSAFGQTASPSAFGQTSQPSAFGQTSQPQSAFGQPSQPVSAFGAAGAGSISAFGASASGLPAKPKVGPPDFATALAAVKAQPGKDIHDSLLPPDYAQRIPASALEVFSAPRFEWGGIPEWVPPIELR